MGGKRINSDSESRLELCFVCDEYMADLFWGSSASPHVQGAKAEDFLVQYVFNSSTLSYDFYVLML